MSERRHERLHREADDAREVRSAVAEWLNGAPRADISPVAEESPVIDDDIVRDLPTVVSERESDALVEMFSAAHETQARRFAEGLNRGRYDEIADKAHRILSPAGSLGARRAKRLAICLETAYRSGDVSSVADFIDMLSASLLEACAALRRWRASDDRENRERHRTG